MIKRRRSEDESQKAEAVGGCSSQRGMLVRAYSLKSPYPGKAPLLHVGEKYVEEDPQSLRSAPSSLLLRHEGEHSGGTHVLRHRDIRLATTVFFA